MVKLIQVAHAIYQHDGASEVVLSLDRIFKQLGYASMIYAHTYDERQQYPVRPLAELVSTPEDIIIYHMTGDALPHKWIYTYPGKVVLVYRALLPGQCFGKNIFGTLLSRFQVRRELRRLLKHTMFAWGDSSHSCEKLHRLGLIYAKILPALAEPEKYLGYKPLPLLYKRYQDGCCNLLVVGRGVPYKKQDEALRILKYYHDHISEHVRLLLVGKMEAAFDKRLHALVKELQLQEHVVFTGQVSQEELCTYYRLADAVLSLSEHEGFCVPIVEGMIFDKPVFAYACPAVPETMGKAGILLTDKTPAVAAQLIHHTLEDTAVLQQLALERKKRLAELSYDRLYHQVEADLKEIITLWRENR